MLLLCAAGLKLAGQNVSAVPQVGWYATPMVQMAAAEWELVLGIWLLSGRYRIGSWFASVATFLTFAAISGYLGFVGVASCGCFGAIKASPWYAFGVDVIALLFLGLFRPDFSTLRKMTRIECRRLALNGLGSILSIGVLIATITGAATLASGSPEAALARLRGEWVSISPAFVDFGNGTPGASLESTITVLNLSNRPLRLIGGTADCSCVTTTGLPATIEPGKSQNVLIRLIVKPSRPGSFTRPAELWLTDGVSQRAIKLQVGCRVIAPGSSSLAVP